MTNQSQPPENQAAARERAPERIWMRLEHLRSRSLLVGDPGIERRSAGDVEYVRADLLQQPAISERCGECGHDLAAPRHPLGWCVEVLRDAGGSLVHCGCKCVYPATGAGEDERRDDDSCSHWRDEDGHCVLCGDDLGPTTEVDVSPAPVVEGEGQDDGWVTFGRVRVDIENETQTFERIDPPESSTVTASVPPLTQGRTDKTRAHTIRELANAVRYRMAEVTYDDGHGQRGVDPRALNAIADALQELIDKPVTESVVEEK
jgi:hypothetical protein